MPACARPAASGTTCMRPYGGFEHNLQSLRVVDQLEERYAEFPGLNLTFECREGILKHCSARNARQLGELGERFLKRRQPGLEAQIANLADEIAYNNHDVDDGMRAGLIEVKQLLDVSLFRRQHEVVERKYPQLTERRQAHEVIRRMINYVVIDVIQTTQSRIADAKPKSIDDVRNRAKPLAGMSDEVRAQHLKLKKFLNEHVYQHHKVQRMTSKARRVISELFDAFLGDEKLLPPEHRLPPDAPRYTSPELARARAAADYIAGMTDRYATLEHRTMVEPGA